MLKRRPALFLVALLALGGLLGAACGSDDAPGDTTAAEPAPAPAEPAAPEPAPPPPANPPPATHTAEPPADSEPEPPAETAATEEVPEAPADGFPVTIESTGGTWTLESPPGRIVSLSPMATEILFAIGAGPQVVAVDNWSTHPPEAPTTDLSGYDPNVEAVTAFEPDLVVVVNDANNLVAGLTALDIPVLVSPSPATIEDGYGAVEALGLATGNSAEAAGVAEALRVAIAEALADAPDVAIRIYHELDQTYFSVSSHSFIGSVYTALGATNIADPADGDGYGYPQLTEEYIIEADPELIVITDLTAYTADDVAARPGWETISAVRDGNILMVDADSASRWGPRLPLFVATIAGTLAAIAGATG